MKLRIASATLLISLLSAFTSVLPAVAADDRDCTIIGTNRSEKLVGTEGYDVICAAGGSDIIYGLGGDDVIWLGTGNDKVFGGSGDDEIYAEAGNDTVNGGPGDDTVNGGSGADTLNGLAGEDVLLGGSGVDKILGGNDSDSLNGGTGADTIGTGAGEDVCSSDKNDKMLDACMLDKIGPDFGVATTEFKTFTAGTTAEFTINATDASGVQSIYGYIGGADGWVTTWCGFGIEAELVAGDHRSGTYKIFCDIPKDAVNENYGLFLGASDVMGNASRSSAYGFQVVGGSIDNASPEVTEINLPASVRAGESFNIQIRASDTSGVGGIYAWFLLDGGGFSDGNTIYAKGAEPVTITKEDTETLFEQEITFASAAPEGTYTMWISVRDILGNRNFFDTGRKLTVTR